MITLKGKYSEAKIFTDNIDQETISQILNLCNQDFTWKSKIRIMPDTHAGAGCVIGFTANLGDKVIPNIVGVDIGCGMLTIELGKVDIDLERLDNIIHTYIPNGKEVHPSKQTEFELKDLYCYRELKDTKRIERSIGTLGGGNHFIEVNEDDEGNKYLVIHSGSRNLGKQVADYYQNLAIELRSGKEEYYNKRDGIIKVFKAQGRKDEIQKALKELEKQYTTSQPDYPRELCFLEGEYRDRYLWDMEVCQKYASLNRHIMADIIIREYFKDEITKFPFFQTIHNYINFNDNIIRKGSISAYEGQKVLIPINMRDGSILAIGKGNPDWNYSAPHGAGRLMSRSKAKETLKLEDFQETMQGIYSTTINQSTLDEAPMAYKPMEEILNNIQDTVEVIKIIKPLYNFKASE